MKMPVSQYVDKFLLRLFPYPRQFIFVTSVADFDAVVTELARRQTAAGISNKWLSHRGHFKGNGICASGNQICVLGALYDTGTQLSPANIAGTIGTMQHEIQHMLLHTCAQIGYNPMREHEPFTYLTKWVFELFLAFMRNYHGVMITDVQRQDTGMLSRLQKGGAFELLHALPVENVRDSLARESRALLNNAVVVSPIGASRSTTYFEL
ncbi:hypothetical protein FDH97_gp231 [Erwinia phage vB_EamM_Deimos-Minion]|uniref:Uncharacterized protein n=1 Tax=Erwinia phage vB_EamM_Deimos-Minion TaxID=1815986 RepID=A0A173GF57_9CAUD|nr:hypothetical protein FDH97_gp231 [Erwinia phage vB_EamM_Deimos-Minion]ANH52331.1 hypothetical protein DM_231 [Erwinia phage vB_EamM_Deimos-Minion]